MIFKKDQIYKCSQIEWGSISIVLKVTKSKVTFKDIEIDGGIGDISFEADVWEQLLPLSFKSPEFEYIGDRKTHPEYFL